MWKDDDITPAVLLDHMQCMKYELTTQMGKMGSDINDLKKDVHVLKQDVHVLKQDVRKINFALQRLYERRIETVERIDSHDVRIGKLEKHTGLVPTKTS